MYENQVKKWGNRGRENGSKVDRQTDREIADKNSHKPIL